MPLTQETKPGHERRSLKVDLPGEGVYGLYLVVKSGAGLGKAAPKNGDFPQLRVEVDTTAPLANLFQPKPDASQQNVLVLTWSASDRNLAPNPITLEWTEDNKGAWKSIARDLPNTGSHPLPPGTTGSYGWTLPAGIPPKVYLRLVARDKAGNFAVAETSEPVNVDLSQPEVISLSLSRQGP